MRHELLFEITALIAIEFISQISKSVQLSMFIDALGMELAEIIVKALFKVQGIEWIDR